MPQTFSSSPNLAFFKEYQDLFTYGCLVVGSLRLFGLFVNGHWAEGTPAVRLVGSLAGTAIFGAFVGSLLKAPSITWGIVTYSGLMIAELISSYYSASDLANHTRYNKGE